MDVSENLSNFKEESDSITNKDGSINFWSTIEDEQSKKSHKNKEKRDAESFEDGLGMKFRRPASRWYDTGGDLSKAQDQDDLSRKRKMKDEYVCISSHYSMITLINQLEKTIKNLKYLKIH